VNDESGGQRSVSIIPNALTTPAFEHLDDLSRLTVQHCSNKLQHLTAETAAPARGALEFSDFLCLK
jgi:hypothetical protein